MTEIVNEPNGPNGPILLGVVGKGFDGFIWFDAERAVNGSFQWDGWKVIPGGGPFQSAPAIVYARPYVYVFAQKNDSLIYWTRNDVSSVYSSANWSPWATIPTGILTSAPAAIALGSSVLVAARGGDNAFWFNLFDGSNWNGWAPVPGGAFKSEPAISQWGSGAHLDFWGQGLDNSIWVSSWDLTWAGYSAGPWNQVPNGTLSTAPAAYSLRVGQAAVVAASSDGKAWMDLYQQ
jgi:hypothetical protein